MLTFVNFPHSQIRVWTLENKTMLAKYSGCIQSKFIIKAIFCGFEDMLIASGSEDGQV